MLVDVEIGDATCLNDFAGCVWCRVRGRYDVTCVCLFLISRGTVALFDTWTSFSRLWVVRHTHLIDLLPVSTSKTLRSRIVLLVHTYRCDSPMVASSCHHFLLLNSQQGVIVLTTSLSFWILSLMPALGPHFTDSSCLCRLWAANCVMAFRCGSFLLRAHFRAIVVILDSGLNWLSCVESCLSSRVSLLHMVWVELWRIRCLRAKDKCRIKLHILEIAELLLDALRSVFDWLMRRLHHCHWSRGELLVLQVRIVRRCYLWWIDRGEPLSHHLAHLHLLVAVDLLEEARQLLSHVHLLRLWDELVDLKWVVTLELGAIRRRYFWVQRRLFGRGHHFRSLVSTNKLDRLSCV